MKYKLTTLDALNNEVMHDYGSIYEIEETRNSERLKIGVSYNQVLLLINLLDNLEPPYFLLYVLVVSRTGKEPGRYQSPLLNTEEEVIDFLLDFREYFETDGRLHLWIGTLNNNGTVVFDQHNVVYAYGPLQDFKAALAKLNFKEKEFEFPAPHIHNFHDSNDVCEEAVLNYWEWRLFPIEDNDEYN